MSRYGMEWAPYVSVAERRRKAERLVAKLRKQGRSLEPVVIEGRAIAATFWGKAWCSNLEAYRDYESRLPRGRTYARNGAVIDLQIAPGEVRALVNGSELYETEVRIQALPQPAWQRLRTDCAGRIDSLVGLLQGKLSKAVMERLCRQQGGLFPRPAEIRFACSCLDHAAMCKHVAAVLYGVGARFDRQPELLFRLRAVDGAELVAGAASSLPLAAAAPLADRLLQADDMAALFGLDLAAPEVSERAADPSPAVLRAKQDARVPADPLTAEPIIDSDASNDATGRRKAVSSTPKKAAISRAAVGSPDAVETGTSISATRKSRKPAGAPAKASAGASAAASSVVQPAPRASRSRAAQPAPARPKGASAGAAARKASPQGMPDVTETSGTSVKARQQAKRDRARGLGRRMQKPGRGQGTKMR